MKILLLFFLLFVSRGFSGEVVLCENDLAGEVALVFPEDILVLVDDAVVIFENERLGHKGIKNIVRSDIESFDFSNEQISYIEVGHQTSVFIHYNFQALSFNHSIEGIFYKGLMYENCIRSKVSPEWLNQELVEIY